MQGIGWKIKKIREMKGISQEYMADQLGISQSLYSQIENEKIQIDEDRLKQIARSLQVSPEDIKNFNPACFFNHSPFSGNHYSNVKSNDISEELLHSLLEELRLNREERKLMMDLMRQVLSDIQKR
ncbi:MAG: hypothetical protein KatS3mg028_1078 [Bacteroidia bacterium]|nr:MAG: hypothetical protein KatS3mg028_1078 [Bacteroidia bacterium]